MGSSLVVHGPLEIGYVSIAKTVAKRIEKEHIPLFWEHPEARALDKKQGCYVFALRAGRGFTAWYVGKATKGFRQEAFQSHKLVHYNSVLAKGHKGTPVMFFIAPDGAKKKVPEAHIDDLETFLIQTALFKNPEISNIAKTKNVPQWGIAGILRSERGRPSAKAQVFARMMGL